MRRELLKILDLVAWMMKKSFLGSKLLLCKRSLGRPTIEPGLFLNLKIELVHS